MNAPPPNRLPPQFQDMDLAGVNLELDERTAEERVAWVLARLKPQVVLSSSFGAQAAVLLHMVTRQWPDVPVVVTDTGYLFPETYRFIDMLTERLNLNLKVYRAELSPAWQEARYGKLWEAGVEGLTRYNRMNKVEPMQRALDDLDAVGWIVGLRRAQAKTRRHLNVLGFQNGYLKVHPIVDWNDKDVYDYLTANGLTYNPLWEQGYVSIGDVHTSHRISDGMAEEEARFFGLKRECGLHEDFDEPSAQEAEDGGTPGAASGEDSAGTSANSGEDKAAAAGDPSRDADHDPARDPAKDPDKPRIIPPGGFRADDK